MKTLSFMILMSINFHKLDIQNSPCTYMYSPSRSSSKQLRQQQWGDQLLPLLSRAESRGRGRWPSVGLCGGNAGLVLRTAMPGECAIWLAHSAPAEVEKVASTGPHSPDPQVNKSCWWQLGRHRHPFLLSKGQWEDTLFHEEAEEFGLPPAERSHGPHPPAVQTACTVPWLQYLTLLWGSTTRRKLGHGDKS